MLKLIPLLFLIACTPNRMRAEAEHVSHPFAGPPFGPSHEEDQLTHACALSEWEGKIGFYFVTGLCLKVGGRNYGGMYGPTMTGVVRVGKVWELK